MNVYYELVNTTGGRYLVKEISAINRQEATEKMIGGSGHYLMSKTECQKNWYLDCGTWKPGPRPWEQKSTESEFYGFCESDCMQEEE